MTGKHLDREGLAERVAADLRKPPYRPGQLLPSERELSAHYGVSRPTLRKALSALQAGGLVKSLPGKGHRLLERRTRPATVAEVTLLVPDLTNPFYAGLASAFSRALSESPFQGSVVDFQERLDTLGERLGALRESRGGSFVLHFPGDRESLLAFAAQSAGPLVLMHPFADLASVLPFDQILLGSFGGGRKAVSHLLQLGRRRIAFVGLPGQAPERFRGGMAAVHEGGFDAELLSRLDLHLPGFSGAHEAVTRAVSRGSFPDALFCANDDVALGCLAGLHEAGLSVPGQVMVTGFDDIPAARLVRPALTTIRQPLGELAALAKGLVLAQQSAGFGEKRVVSLEGELIARESTGSRPNASPPN
jgi:LacI family transcriptional regulator